MNSIVEALAVAAARRPDKIAVIAERQEITYGELWREVRGFAAYLQSQGLEKGSRVIVKSQPSIWCVVALFGCHLAGCPFVPVNGKIGVEGLKQFTEQFSPSMVIFDVNIEGCGCIMMDPSSVRTLAADNFDETIRFDFPRPEDLCDIMFTTGTTGKSKGVMLTHRAIVAATENYNFGHILLEDNVHLTASPFNHTSGLRPVNRSVLTGTTIALLDDYLNTKLFFEYLRDYHVTSANISPMAVRILLLVAGKELAKYDGQFDFISTGGTFFPETDMERLRELLPHARLYFTYGATEAGSTSALEYSKYKKDAGCVGKANVNSHTFIVDDDRKEIWSSKDNPGLIAISGTNIMSGYYNEPELTKETLVDGVLYTNDIGYMDEEGYLYILGRKGDVINKNGFKIAPMEIEDVALRFPGIAECAYFAVQNERGATELKLNIVEQPGLDIQITELREHMRGHLEAFKVPKLIEKVGEIPRTANGKIDRKALK